MRCLVALAAGVLLTACGGSTDDSPRGGITVFAAASLSDVLDELASGFAVDDGRVDVAFNFAGTPTLRVQLEQGARADVFATANPEQMRLAQANGVVEAEAVVFARSSLVVITPQDNPGGIETLADLRREGLKLVVANPNVPAGAYAGQMLSRLEAGAGFGPGFAEAVLDNVVSLESSVKQVLLKVALGEADAGVVYGTDVVSEAGADLRVIQVPAEFNVVVEYVVAVVRDARQPGLAQAFIDYLLSERGQEQLRLHGFLPPSS